MSYELSPKCEIMFGILMGGATRVQAEALVIGDFHGLSNLG